MDGGSIKQGAGKRRGWREDPLSTFLLVGAIVLALMYGLETRQRAGLDARDLQAQAIAERAGFAEPDCVIGAAGAGGEILVVACERESLERVQAGVSAGLSDFSGSAGFTHVYLVGQDDAGHRERRMCEMTKDLTIELEHCRDLKGRGQSEDRVDVVVGAVGAK